MNNEQQKKSSQMGDGTQQEGLVDQAKHVMSTVAEKVGEQVSHGLDEKKGKALEKIGGAAEALRWGSGLLKNVGPLGELSEKAADGVEGVASFLENKQIGDVVRDVERFARREPALFFGAAFAIGLIGGRFLKSSSTRSEESEMGGDMAMGSYRSHRDEYDYYDDGDDFDRFGMSERSMSYGTGPDTRRNGSQGGMSSGSGGMRGGNVGMPNTGRLGGTTTGTTGLSGTGTTQTTGTTSGAIKPQPIVNAGSTTGSTGTTGGMTGTKGKNGTVGSTGTSSMTDKPRNGSAG